MIKWVEVDNFVDFDQYNSGKPFKCIYDYYSDIVFNNPSEYHLYKTKVSMDDGKIRHFIILTLDISNKVYTKEMMDKMCIVEITHHTNMIINNKIRRSEAIISIMETESSLAYMQFNAIETDILFIDKFNIPQDKRIIFLCTNYDKFIEKVSPDFYNDPLFKICMSMIEPKFNTSDNHEELIEKLNNKIDKLYERFENLENTLNSIIKDPNTPLDNKISNYSNDIESYTTLVNNDDLSPTSVTHVSWSLDTKPYIEGDEKVTESVFTIEG